ncbi:GNAT family N-acetyltransferase [Paenibacillus polygoni]|uniref:GNAT family N-acetyltransferase n=1 Tax=Paenibacillus polygoni TaxID=3050112 RepID=A0ABY8X4A3_9BACL|nr:GNAT family N-acetyltransferase [Paenibacillus polygoni]WIV19863.1 GNAT family N-acetyltransferase [Paenibacillus polygoni]
MTHETTEKIMLTIPESFESKRLIIRAPKYGDGAASYEAVQESMEELRPWMPFANDSLTPENSEINIRQAHLKFLKRSDLRLMLFSKENGQLVGSSGLHRIDWDVRKFEIGYWLRSSYAGQGYMSESVEAITNYAIRELAANRIEIRCDARNVKSAKVAERNGFVLEGILRGDSLDVYGKLSDTMLFSKIRGKEF